MFGVVFRVQVLRDVLASVGSKVVDVFMAVLMLEAVGFVACMLNMCSSCAPGMFWI